MRGRSVKSKRSRGDPSDIPVLDRPPEGHVSAFFDHIEPIAKETLAVDCARWFAGKPCIPGKSPSFRGDKALGLDLTFEGPIGDPPVERKKAAVHQNSKRSGSAS